MLCSPPRSSSPFQETLLPAFVDQALCGLFLTMKAAVQRVITLMGDTENAITGKGPTHSFHA